MSSTLPFMKFYPADWSRDPNLLRCSLAARGVWMGLLCLMWECEDRGRLATNGRPWEVLEAAHAIAGDTTEVRRCIEELIEKGVVSVDEDGALVSRRMVRDEAVRKARQQAGSKGGSSHRKALFLAELEQNGSKASSKSEANSEAKGQAKSDLSHARACALTSDLSSSLSESEEKGGCGGEKEESSRGEAEGAELSWEEIQRRRGIFDEGFWPPWPLKRGGREKARAAWNQAVMTTAPSIILDGLHRQLPEMRRKLARASPGETAGVAYAAKWLSEGYWEDATEEEAKAAAKAALETGRGEQRVEELECAGCGGELTAANFSSSDGMNGWCVVCRPESESRGDAEVAGDGAGSAWDAAYPLG